MEELEDKQLMGRLTMVEQENKELREVKSLPLWSNVLLFRLLDPIVPRSYGPLQVGGLWPMYIQA